MTRTEIDYRVCEFTGAVAYVLKYWSGKKLGGKYISPFVFASVENAYHSACIEISGK
jgi:uncharacterized membrane protein YjjB (DUF3815 family)